jgi:hypothetical protein
VWRVQTGQVRRGVGWIGIRVLRDGVNLGLKGAKGGSARVTGVLVSMWVARVTWGHKQELSLSLVKCPPACLWTRPIRTCGAAGWQDVASMQLVVTADQHLGKVGPSI